MRSGRQAPIIVLAFVLGLGCTKRPPGEEAGSRSSPPAVGEEAGDPTQAAAAEAQTELTGRIELDIDPSTKRPRAIWLQTGSGERLVLGVRPEPWIAAFGGVEVVVYGSFFAVRGQPETPRHYQVDRIAAHGAGTTHHIARIGPEIELTGRFVVGVGDPGTKSETERWVEFVAEDGRTFMIGNQAEGPFDRATRIRARTMELSQSVAHTAGPRLWVAAVDGIEVGDAPEPKKTPPTPTAYATTKADLDGDGTPETIEVTDDGRITVGAASHSFGWIHPTSDYWGGLDRENRLTIVDLDGKRRGVMFWQFEEGDVDPDKRYLLLGYRDGRLERLTPKDVPAAHAAEVSVGVGRIAIVEDTCVHDATIGKDGMPRNDGQSRRVIRTLRYDPATAGFVVREKKATTRTACLMAACPFVEVDGARVGEILRRLSEPGLEGEQSLALPPVSGPFELTLLEEKPEWSWIDAVALRVDGRIVRPRECASIPAICADDGKYLHIAPGERVVLRFDVPPSEDVMLLVDGHYVPLRFE